MENYSIIETRPINQVILGVLLILLLCTAGAAGVYYSKSTLLEVELVHERQEAVRVSIKMDYLEKKAEVLQSNYVDLILTGYVRVGPGDMRDLIQEAQQLREAAGTPYPIGLEGVGGEERAMRKAKKKGKRKKVTSQ